MPYANTVIHKNRTPALGEGRKKHEFPLKAINNDSPQYLVSYVYGSNCI